MRQWLLLDNSVGRSQTNQQRMESLVKKTQKTQQSTKIWLNHTRNVLKAVKAVEVLPLVDTLRKALQITLDVYYFYIIQRCENMVLID